MYVPSAFARAVPAFTRSAIARIERNWPGTAARKTSRGGLVPSRASIRVQMRSARARNRWGSRASNGSPVS